MQRLESLDVFRGLTIAGMILVSTPGTWDAVYPQLEHAAWDGSTLADLVFPFLLFAMGAAVPFALARRRGRQSVRRHVFRRAAILFALGLFLNAIQAAPPLSLTTFRIPASSSASRSSTSRCRGSRNERRRERRSPSPSAHCSSTGP